MWDGEVERKDGQGNTQNGEGKRRKQRERHIYIYIEQVQLLAGAADSKADAGQPWHACVCDISGTPTCGLSDRDSLQGKQMTQ